MSRSRRAEPIRQKQATIKPGEVIVFTEIFDATPRGERLVLRGLSESNPTPVLKAAPGPRPAPVVGEPSFAPTIRGERVVVTKDNWWKEGHEPQAAAPPRLPASLPPIPSARQFDAPQLRSPAPTSPRLGTFEFPKPTVTGVSMPPKVTPTAPKWHPPLVQPPSAGGPPGPQRTQSK